jgi:hypothetical protein
VTLTGYVVVLVAAATCQVVALRTGRLPTFGAVIEAVLRHVLGRWLLRLAWLWLGWHLFVRASL